MENKDKIEIFKLGTAIVVGAGIESIVSNAVKSTTPEGNGKINKACTWLGVVVLTCMIGERACAYTDAKIDELVKYVNETMVKVKEELK